MAGHKADNVASTWPTINGEWMPSSLIQGSNFFLNAINNTIWIHFVHRGLAYILLAVVLFWTIKMNKLSRNLFWSKILYY